MIKIQNIHLVDYYFTMKRTGILMYATIGLDSENPPLQSQEITKHQTCMTLS